MNIRSSFFLLFLTLFLFVSSRSHALTAQGAYVYKVNPGSPYIDVDKYRVSTITRGGAANQPFKVLSQVVPKVLFRQVFKKLIGISPYGIGALAAYEAYNYFMDTDSSSATYNQLVQSTSYPTSVSTGTCRAMLNGGSGWAKYNVTFEFCVTWLDSQIPGSSYEASLSHYTEWMKVNSNMQTQSYLNYYRLWVPSDTASAYSTNNVAVSDADFFAAQDSYIQNNPEINHNDMFNDQYGNVIPEMFPNPEYVEFTQEDLDLIGLYEAGLMQSEDPNAANYYTAETIAKAKALSETKAAQDARTAEDEAKKLTEDEKLPITQAQHKTNQLEAEERAKQAEKLKEEKAMASLDGADTTELDKNEKLDESFDLLDGLMNNLSGLPVGLPAIPIFEYSSNCKTISIAANVSAFGMVGSVAFPSPEQCIKILNPIKDMLGWLLYISVSFLMLFQLYKEVH